MRAKTVWMKTKEHVAGVAVWVVGGEEPGFWPEVAAQVGRP